MGTGAAMMAVPIGAAAGEDVAMDPLRLKTYMLMRGALDDRLVIGCVSGLYYGVVDAEITPLFGVVSATFARYRPMASGGYAAVNAEYAFFTDPASGRAMERFRNPYTGETVAVPGGGVAPAKLTILPDLRLQLGQAIPGVQFDHRVGPVETRGDDVWITEVTRTSLARPGQAKPFRYSESTTLHARRSELDAPGAMRVRCETSFTNVVSWRPWLNMGDRPGHLMAIGAGRYGTRIADLPPAWIDATRARHSELLADPAAVLAPLWDAG